MRCFGLGSIGVFHGVYLYIYIYICVFEDAYIYIYIYIWVFGLMRLEHDVVLAHDGEMR